jgi:serine/threonine protein kinase
MRDNSTANSLPFTVTEKVIRKKPAEDYSELLRQYGADYRKSDYYWQVGETSMVQGWIIHLSVIAPQLAELLHSLLPILLSNKLPFKIPNDRETARNILDGNVGYEQLGKVISIYPKNDQDALKLAKQLIPLTASYRGPAIPTDIHLGGVVYTRFGGINPILRQGNNGQMEEHIYDGKGELIKDDYPVPFQLPSGISWPFIELSIPEVKKTKANLRNIYRPMSILKPDPRGDVTKALYLKGLFRVGTCVIKAGKKNMLADDMGRDIQDRLAWQKDLYSELQDIVRLPKILDFFEENGEIYMVMEFIKGKSLHDSLVEIHGNQKSWFQLSAAERTKILDWLIKIIAVIESLHKRSFVHRDIQPGNFIIDPEGEIVLIDTELAYDLKYGNQKLPFELGTPGFMSPEQEAVSIPTIKEDVYGLGALMINMFTCINAPRFNTLDPVTMAKNLTYFIRHRKTADLIARCLHQQPSQRPELSQIRVCLTRYKNELTATQLTSQEDPGKDDRIAESIKTTIKQALIGLGQEPMPIAKGIWLSKTIKDTNGTGIVQKKFCPYGGVHTGMTGVIYLLARAKKAGHDIGTNKIGYKESWKYIYAEYLKKLGDFTPGLYNGAAGIALTLAEGIGVGLLEDSDLIRQYIQKCLEKPNKELNLAEGVAGQGIALLQCSSYMPENKNEELLNNFIHHLLGSQTKEGFWNIKVLETGKPLRMPISWSHGITGIIYFLLKFNARYENKDVQQALNKSLGWLSRQTHDLKGLFVPSIYQKLLDKKPEIGDERTSAILCFIYAYAMLKNPYFKEAAESALYQYPDFVANNNFSQDGGLAALGEVYLEGWKIFKNEEWKKRACQIATVFLHTIYQNDTESCYWLTDESRKPIADLFVGNSGIIHFLLRFNDPDILGHILLE